MQQPKTQDSIIKQLLREEFAQQEKKIIIVVEQKSNELKKEIEILEKSLRLEIKLSSEVSEQRIKKQITKFKDEILTTVDPLLKELENRQQDREVGANQITEIRKTLTNLEKRLAKIEQAQTVS